jgi:ADP-ribose pyrophosphatase YjhB (NUDIX family)/GNAT superfamily N-acetyltransferase
MPKTPTYCPNCSHALTLRDIAGRVRPFCEECGYVHYVNPVPTVGVLIEMDDGLVLIQRGHPPHAERWTFPSGYVEADERLEEAAVREAEEETGLKVEILELVDVNSYPEGPPLSGIMVFYRAKPIGGTLKAGDDAMDARVFKPDELPLLPFRTHREALALWLERESAGQTDARREQPPYHIHMAGAEDAQQVIEMLQMIPSNYDLTPADWEAVKLRLREMPSLNVFVAELNVTPPLVIGCLVLSVARTATGGIGVINDMAVLPVYRRRGVGAALLDAALKRARQLQLHMLMINAPRATEHTRGFYTAAGFEDVTFLQLNLR